MLSLVQRRWCCRYFGKENLFWKKLILDHILGLLYTTNSYFILMTINLDTRLKTSQVDTIQYPKIFITQKRYSFYLALWDWTIKNSLNFNLRQHWDHDSGNILSWIYSWSLVALDDAPCVPRNSSHGLSSTLFYRWFFHANLTQRLFYWKDLFQPSLLNKNKCDMYRNMIFFSHFPK